MRLGQRAGIRFRQVGDVGPVVVLLHGYAAPADDLMPAAHRLAAERPVRVVVPSGPVDYFGLVRAWFTFDTEHHFQLMQAGRHEALFCDRPPGLARTRDQLLRFFLALRDEWGGPPPVLVGFSQGAMMAADLALRTGLPLGGLGLVAGTGIDAQTWPVLARSRQGLATYVGHGAQDGLLPARLGRTIAGWLSEANLDVEFELFEGHHEIGPAHGGLIRLLDRAWNGLLSADEVFHPVRKRATSYVGR